MHVKVALIFCISFLVFLISGCSEIESDNNGPVVISVSPAPNAKLIAATTPIVVEFSEPIDPDALSITTFSIDNEAEGRFVTSGNRVTFYPLYSIGYGQRRTVTLSREIRDVDGNRLESAYTWSFSTRPRPPFVASARPGYGNTGTRVTLVGTGFSSSLTGNIVKFDGTVANVRFASPESLVVEVPPGATSGALAIVNHLGTAYAPTRFVVVKSGVVWIKVETGSDQTLLDVVANDELFVAVGAGGTILTSDNGITWQPRQSGTTHRLNAVTWMGGRFVAVGDVGTVLHSADGVYWQPFSAPTKDKLIDITANPFIFGHSFLALSSSGSVYGTDFVSAFDSLGSFRTRWMFGLSHTPFGFISVGYNGSIKISNGGAMFRSLTSGVNDHLLSISANDTMAIVVGHNGTILTSLGEEWLRRNSTTWRHLSDAVYTGEAFAVAGEAGTILLSEDGVVWFQTEIKTNKALYGIAHAEAGIVAVGEGGIILFSP